MNIRNLFRSRYNRRKRHWLPFGHKPKKNDSSAILERSEGWLEAREQRKLPRTVDTIIAKDWYKAKQLRRQP